MTMIYIPLLIITALLLYARFKMGYSWEDIFSPNRWKAVVVWWLKKILIKLDNSDKYLTKNELLQYSYRVAQCSDCLQAGKCKHCGCDSEGRLNGVTDSCSAGKWGVMLTDEEMDNFLKKNKFIFTVKTESNGTI